MSIQEEVNKMFKKCFAHLKTSFSKPSIFMLEIDKCILFKVADNNKFVRTEDGDFQFYYFHELLGYRTQINADSMKFTMAESSLVDAFKKARREHEGEIEFYCSEKEGQIVFALMADLKFIKQVDVDYFLT